MMGAQVSLAQNDRIMSYLNIGVAGEAQVLIGGSMNGVVKGGYYIKPKIFKGTNDMKSFQEGIFVTTAKTEEEAIQIANDTA